MILRIASILLLITWCCAAAAQSLDIQAMVVGDKVLELEDTVQLTTKADGRAEAAVVSPNGTLVAYATYHEYNPYDLSKTNKLRIVNSRGGPSKTLIDREIPPLPKGDRAWIDLSDLQWSPDGRFLAVAVTSLLLRTPYKYSGEEYTDDPPQWFTDADEGNWILIFSAKGVLVGSYGFDLDDGTLQFVWSRDSRKLAVCHTRYFRDELAAPSESSGSAPTAAPPAPAVDGLPPMNTKASRTETDIVIYDLTTRAAHPAGMKCKEPITLIEWANGNSVYYASYALGPAPGQMHLAALDGSFDRKVDRPYPEPAFSGVYELLSGPGVTVKNKATGQVIKAISAPDVEFRGWTPDGRLFCYNRVTQVYDDAKQRATLLRTYWLAAPEEHKLNDMCLAADTTQASGGEPSWSNDSLTMAFNSNGSIHAVHLAWREATTDEKVAAWVPLTEAEEKQVLQRSGSTIASVLRDEAEEHGAFPLAEAVQEVLRKRVGDAEARKLSMRTGTQQTILTCVPSTEQSTVPSPRLIAYLDAGYSWRVNIYADGSAKVEEKK